MHRSLGTPWSGLALGQRVWVHRSGHPDLLQSGIGEVNGHLCCNSSRKRLSKLFHANEQTCKVKQWNMVKRQEEMVYLALIAIQKKTGMTWMTWAFMEVRCYVHSLTEWSQSFAPLSPIAHLRVLLAWRGWAVALLVGPVAEKKTFCEKTNWKGHANRWQGRLFATRGPHHHAKEAPGPCCHRAKTRCWHEMRNFLFTVLQF